MPNTDHQTLIERFIAAYNSFDIDGLISLLHPDIVFQNISGGEVNAEAVGLDQFRTLAEQSRAVFSSRRQQTGSFDFDGDIVCVTVDFPGVLAVDMPNGLKAGQEIRLAGRSLYQFRDGKIARLTDIS